MSGSTVTRWVISDDGSHLIRREEAEASFPKDVEAPVAQVKEDDFDRPATNVSTSLSLSTNKRNVMPVQLPVSYPCAYCDICFTASHYLEKHVKRSHRKQYLEMLRSRNITFSQTPALTLATLSKTPTSTSATFGKAPTSTSATLNKTTTSTSATLSKAPASSSTILKRTPMSTSATFSRAPPTTLATFNKAFPRATFSKTSTSPPAACSKTPASPSRPSGPSFLQAPLVSPESIHSPAKVESSLTSQAEEPQVSECSPGSTPIDVTPVTPERTSDPASLPPALDSTKPSVTAPSDQVQIAMNPIPKESAAYSLSQPLCPSSEAEEVKERTQKNLPSSCTYCGGRRERRTEGEGEKDCCCVEGTLFLCNECGQSFPSFSSLSFHQDQVHWEKGDGRGEEEGETLYLCTECGLSFPRLELLGHHQSLHDSPGAKDQEEGTEEEEKDEDDDSLPFASPAHTCPNCQKIFKTARYLKTHMKIHSGQVPYHCDQCDKPFTQLGDLKTHRRTHTGERPYQCSQCGKCFGRSGTLKKHWRTHTGETPYVCMACGKQFNQLGALKTHERIHTGQRPYFCSRCSQHFTYSYQLKRHRCVHSEKGRGASD